MKGEYKQTRLIIALFTKKFQKMGKDFQNEIQAKGRKKEEKERGERKGKVLIYFIKI